MKQSPSKLRLFINVSLVLALTFQLAACGGDNSSGDDDSGSSRSDEDSVTLEGSGSVIFTVSGLAYSDDTVTMVIYIDGTPSEVTFDSDGSTLSYSESFSGWLYQSPYHSCSIGSGSADGSTTTFPISCKERCDPDKSSGFGGGNGSSDKPFAVCSAGQLQYLENATFSGFYNNVKQYADIDLAGSGFTQITAFNGANYDGNLYKISNLTLDASGEDGAGLFRTTDGSTLARITLENVDVTGYAPSADADIGGLVGYAYDTDIVYSRVTGTVTSGVHSGSRVVWAGGLVGYAQFSDILGCAFQGSVTAQSRSSSDYQYVGGLAGYLHQTDVSAVYTRGTVDGGYDHVGGLAGESYGSNIITSFSTASVSGRAQIGGMLGSTDGDASTHGTLIDESYFTGSVDCSSGSNCGAFIGFIDTTGSASGNVTGIFNFYSTGSLNAAGNLTIDSTIQRLASLAAQMKAATGTDYNTGLTDEGDFEIILFTSDTWVDLNGDSDTSDDWETTDAAGVFTFCNGSYPSFDYYCD